MSTLSNTNVSWDGMRDIFDGTSMSSGSSAAWSINNADGRARYPIWNGGQGDNKRPTSTSHTNADSDTTISADDLKSIVKADFAVSTWTFGSSKEAQTFSTYAWGTAGGLAAATAGGVTSTQGSLWDGSSQFTSGAKAFDEINSGFDDNKDIHYLGYTLQPLVKIKAVFSGSGSSTSDTDWTTMYVSAWDEAATDRNYGATYARSGATASSYTHSGTAYHVYTWTVGIGAVSGMYTPVGGSSTWIHSFKFV